MSTDHTIGVMKNNRLLRLVTTCGMSRNRVEEIPNSITTQQAFSASIPKPGTANSDVRSTPGCGTPPSLMEYGLLSAPQKMIRMITYTNRLCRNINVCRQTVRSTYTVSGAGRCLISPSLDMNVSVPSVRHPMTKFQTMKPVVM